jgi:hypothetical protein
MPELSLQNVDLISRDISRQEITFSHLLEDLIDHICCDIEYEMQSSGLDFIAAYNKVKQKMGSRRLKEIQEETLYAVDTKYRHMKNTMKISGIIGTVLLGFAALFKIQHWPLAGTMLTLGAFTLAFIFMPSSLGVLWKETHNRKRLFLFISAFLAGMFFIIGTLFKVQHWPVAGILLLLAALFGVAFFIPSLLVSKLQDQENKAKRPVYILGAVGFIIYAAGMIFKIQHWPLAGLLLVLGMIILCGFVFPWYTWITWEKESYVNPKFLYMVIGLLAIIIPGALINLNLQRNYEEGFYTHQAQQKALYTSLYKYNNSIMIMYHDSLFYPQMEQLHAKTVSLLTLIGNIQTKMVQESEGEPGKPAVSSDQISRTDTGIEIQYNMLTNPFYRIPVRDFLLPGSSSREQLNSEVAEYAKYISELLPGEDLQKYTGLIEPSVYIPGTIPDRTIISLMSGLHSLELLKNSILTVESNMLKAVANHK